jgi:hypothetical protein
MGCPQRLAGGGARAVGSDRSGWEEDRSRSTRWRCWSRRSTRFRAFVFFLTRRRDCRATGPGKGWPQSHPGRWRRRRGSGCAVGTTACTVRPEAGETALGPSQTLVEATQGSFEGRTPMKREGDVGYWTTLSGTVRARVAGRAAGGRSRARAVSDDVVAPRRRRARRRVDEAERCAASWPCPRRPGRESRRSRRPRSSGRGQGGRGRRVIPWRGRSPRCKPP